jgi:hypothetical protein
MEKQLETRTVHDPFIGADVQISDRLVDRLRGKYASGPHLPNGRPEFGWRQFQAPPIQHEAAARIEALEAALAWYGEQARLSRLIHSGGDTGRHALANDGGKRAAQLLGISE